jgi:hypothetical protein
MDHPEKIFDFIRSECARLKIDPASYRIGNDFTIEQGEIAFDHDGENWRVYIIERGIEYNVATIYNTIDAVRYFFMKVATGPENHTMPKINFKDMP